MQTRTNIHHFVVPAQTRGGGFRRQGHVGWKTHLFASTPFSLDTLFLLFSFFPRDIFFTWHLFPLAFLSFDISSLGTFFCLTSLFLHASSLEIFPLTCQTHLHSNLAQQLIGQSRRRIAKYQSRTLRAHSKLSMLSCQKRMSETQQVTVHFSSVWKGIFNGKCKMSCHTRSLSSSIDATIHCAKQPWDCKTPKHQREGKRQKSLDAAVRLHRATT